MCIYFPLKIERVRATKNVCVAFNTTTERELYRAIRRMSSTEIKKRISIFSYGHLAAVAKKENRGITEVIKMRLADSFHRGRRIRRIVSVSGNDLARWRAALIMETEKHGHSVFKEILSFFDGLNEHEAPKERLAA